MAAVPYHLGRFPPTEFDWPQLIPLIGPANAALARYDGLLTAIPNAAVLLSPLTTQEAVLSSRIEGTQATMGEVLEYEAGAGETLDPSKREDIEEVLNYRTAMRQATDQMQGYRFATGSSRTCMRRCCLACGGTTRRGGSSARFKTTSACMAGRSKRPVTFRSLRRSWTLAWRGGKSICTK